MAAFSLEIIELIPPDLPGYDGVPIEQIKSPRIPHPASATSSLYITLRLGDRGLAPATHLMLTYHYEGTADLLVPDPIGSGDLEPLGDGVYRIEIPPRLIYRAKVNEGETATARLTLRAMKGEKTLGQFEVGEIKGLGLEGYKSFPLAKRRVEQWKQQAERKG